MRPHTILAPLLAAALAAASMTLYGQPPRPSGEEAANGAPELEAPVTASQAAAGDSTAGTPAAAPGNAKGPANSPFEYEPSEDISEDLSVSFPVDI